MGWRNLFSFPVELLCQFLFWWEISCGFTYYLCTLEYHKVVVFCQFFLFWREILFSVSYIWYLLYSYSCAVVSDFWLWREIVLKMRTRFYKKILLGYFIMIRQPMCVYFSCTAQICTLKFKSEYYLRINTKLCQKCKHRQSHFDFQKNAYPISLFLRNNSLVKRFQHSICISSVKTKTNTEISFSF